MNEPTRNTIYAFGDFRVDFRKRQLFRVDRPVQLTAKAFDTLAALIAADGETVSKTELIDVVWPETAVEENNLTQQISALRKVFGERAGDHKFIVTIPGRGYRFVAVVRTIEVKSEGEFTDARERKKQYQDLRAPAGSKHNSIFGYSIAAIYILIVCAPAFLVIWRAESQGLKPQSIAILRFRSAGLGDELLGMGIRDTLRAKLGSIEEVTVSPTEPTLSEDVIDAGRQLNVDVVLTGSIQHDNDRIRVAVEMVDISSQRIVWGNTFDNDSSKSFELQDSILNAVLNALKRPRYSRDEHSRLTSERLENAFVAALNTPNTARRKISLPDFI